MNGLVLVLNAIGPKFCLVTPLPLSTPFVIVPPLTQVWIAPISEGPLVPVLAIE